MLNNFPTPLVSTLGVVSVEREDVKLFFGTRFTVGSFREVSETGVPKVHIFFGTPFWPELQFLALGAPASMHLEIRVLCTELPKVHSP